MLPPPMLDLLEPFAAVRTVLLQVARLVAACTRTGDGGLWAAVPAGAVLGRRHVEAELAEPLNPRRLRPVPYVGKGTPKTVRVKQMDC